MTNSADTSNPFSGVRRVIVVSGEDRTSFLQNTVTQNIEALADGEAGYSCLLSAQGKILFDFFVVNSGTEYQLSVHAQAAEKFLKRLSLYKLRAKITIELRDDIEDIPLAPSDVENNEQPNSIIYQDPRTNALGFRAIGPVGRNTPDPSYLERRISLGAAESFADFESDAVFLLDVNYDVFSGVDYAKGCFIGQEVSSRMKRKGEIRKRTAIIRSATDIPAPGTAIEAEGASLGTIMSGFGTSGIAIIRIDRLARAQNDGIELLCGAAPVEVRLPDMIL